MRLNEDDGKKKQIEVTERIYDLEEKVKKLSNKQTKLESEV